MQGGQSELARACPPFSPNMVGRREQARFAHPTKEVIMNRAFVNRAVAVVLAAGFLLTAGCPKVNAPKGVAVQSDAVASAPLEMRPDVKELAVGETLDVPYILWGGDVATFMANGGE